MKTKLVDPSDDALNEAFAEYVAGWKRVPGEQLSPNTKRADSFHSERGWECTEINPTRFTTSADAVLPWLEKAGWHSGRWAWSPRIRVLVSKPDQTAVTGEAATFPRAAVIALLRAHGVEIEFTK